MNTLNIIDLRTIILEQTVIYGSCTIVVGYLWQQYRQRFEGLGFWLINFVLQTLGLVLLVMRGIIPAWVSVLVSNAFILGGSIFVYSGLERFVGKRSKQFHNVVMLVLVVVLHSYFTFVQPNLAVRTINFSMGLLFITVQTAWLMLRRVDEKEYPLSRGTGFIFVAYALVSLIRIAFHLIMPTGNDFLNDSGIFEAAILLMYTVLLLGVTFSLFGMINGRLDSENQQQQEAIRISEARYRDLVELSPDAIFVYEDEKIIFVNSAALALLGAKSATELVGKNLFEFVHLDFRMLSRRRVENVSRHGGAAPMNETKLICLDDRIIDVEVKTVQIEYVDRLAFQTIARDITARKRTESILHLRLKLIEFAIDHTLEEMMTFALDEIGEITQSPIGFYHFVEDDQVTISLQAWSTRTLQEFCHAEGEGMQYELDQAGVWVDCIHQRGSVIHNDYASLPHRKGLPPGHAPIERELVVPTLREGKIVSILGVGNKSSNYDQQDIEMISYVAGVIWDIIARKRAETQLQNYQRQLEQQNLELRKFSLAIEQSGNSVIVIDADGLIEYVNPHFEMTSGYVSNEVQGKRPSILNSGMQDESLFREAWETISNGKIWHGEIHNKQKNGDLYWESATIAPVQNVDGKIVNYIAIKEDISDRKHMEAELQRMATTDSLTGVLNRRQLGRVAEQELKRAHRYGHITSVLMLDLDYLKQINDGYGHGAGDIAINRTAQAIKDNLRESDFIGRYGGDEFVIILPETDCDHAMILAERLRSAVAAQKLRYGTDKFSISISLGLACLESKESEPVPGFDTVTTLADQALYAAKAAGRNCVRVR
jgi:diguanylate cyclase (GGDEF)-like protein/PAS domain S-box-containing protein